MIFYLSSTIDRLKLLNSTSKANIKAKINFKIYKTLKTSYGMQRGISTYINWKSILKEIKHTITSKVS